MNVIMVLSPRIVYPLRMTEGKSFLTKENGAAIPRLVKISKDQLRLHCFDERTFKV